MSSRLCLEIFVDICRNCLVFNGHQACVPARTGKDTLLLECSSTMRWEQKSIVERIDNCRSLEIAGVNTNQSWFAIC